MKQVGGTYSTLRVAGCESLSAPCLATLIGFLGDFDLAEEAAETPVGGLQDFDDDESAHTGAKNSL